MGEKLVTILRDLGPVERIAIIHANAEPYAEEIRVLFEQEFGIQNPLICTIGPAIGTHTGPGMVGFACVLR